VTKTLQTKTDSKCRLDKQFDEIAEHVITACPILAREQYTYTRHDTLFAHIHSNISKEIRVKLDKEHWYYYVSKTVETSRKVKVTILRSTSANRQNYSYE
jgi:hypothetical protein